MTDQEQGKSFAELMAGGFDGPQHFEPGQKVRAVVAGVGKEWMFLDLGGKSEGHLALREVVDADGNLRFKVGDSLEAYFLALEKNGMLFTMSLSGGPGAHEHLEDAFRNKIPVEGFVTKEIKGGFEVKIGGSVRGFCPYSQIDIRRAEKAEEYIDRHFNFMITEYSNRNIVLSRRKVLEQERRRQKEELQATLKIGDSIKGRITSVRDFGAFIDVGGIEGLVPVSEIGWGRVEDVHTILEKGQEVEVAVLKLDWDNDRYSFSLKATLADPWEGVAGKYPVGSNHVGTVSRLTNFGAFITLEPGVDGLLHISQLAGGRKINHPREVVQVGQEIEVRVESLDPIEKRLSLAFAAAVLQEGDEGKNSEEDYKKYLAKDKATSKSSMGTLGELLKEKLDGSPKKT